MYLENTGVYLGNKGNRVRAPAPASTPPHMGRRMGNPTAMTCASVGASLAPGKRPLLAGVAESPGLAKAARVEDAGATGDSPAEEVDGGSGGGREQVVAYVAGAHLPFPPPCNADMHTSFEGRTSLRCSCSPRRYRLFFSVAPTLSCRDALHTIAFHVGSYAGDFATPAPVTMA